MAHRPVRPPLIRDVERPAVPGKRRGGALGLRGDPPGALAAQNCHTRITMMPPRGPRGAHLTYDAIPRGSWAPGIAGGCQCALARSCEDLLVGRFRLSFASACSSRERRGSRPRAAQSPLTLAPRGGRTRPGRPEGGLEAQEQVEQGAGGARHDPVGDVLPGPRLHELLHPGERGELDLLLGDVGEHAGGEGPGAAEDGRGVDEDHLGGGWSGRGRRRVRVGGGGGGAPGRQDPARRARLRHAGGRRWAGERGSHLEEAEGVHGEELGRGGDGRGVAILRGGGGGERGSSEHRGAARLGGRRPCAPPFGCGESRGVSGGWGWARHLGGNAPTSCTRGNRSPTPTAAPAGSCLRRGIAGRCAVSPSAHPPAEPGRRRGRRIGAGAETGGRDGTHCP